ncbi:hypothetical protein C8Q74DRAFT_1305926 [Fomes fomentarius]|nr:hypothetical protein C8Q74DRAFT_1305926 [Fomes fomentarius]
MTICVRLPWCLWHATVWCTHPIRRRTAQKSLVQWQVHLRFLPGPAVNMMGIMLLCGHVTTQRRIMHSLLVHAPCCSYHRS